MEPNLLPTLFQNLTQAIQISAEAQQNAARELATQRAQSQETMQFMQHHLEQQRIQYLTDVRSLNELHATNLNQALARSANVPFQMSLPTFSGTENFTSWINDVELKFNALKISEENRTAWVITARSSTTNCDEQ